MKTLNLKEEEKELTPLKLYFHQSYIVFNILLKCNSYK